MAGLILPARFTRQPQVGPLAVDWGNPIARGLTLLSTDNLSVNLVTLHVQTYAAGSGSASKVVTPVGTGWKASGTGGVSFNGSDKIFGNGDVTAMFVGNPSAVATIKVAFRQTSASGLIWFAANDDENEAVSSGTLCLGLLETGVNRSSVKALGAIDGTMSAYLLGKKTGSGTAYKNGTKLTATTTGSLGGSPSTGAATFKILGDNASGGSEFTDTLVLVCAWDRLLSDAEAASITSNPWQLFKSTRRVFAPPAIGGGVTGTGLITPGAQVLNASGAVAIGVTASLSPSAQTASSASTIALSASASITPDNQKSTSAATIALSASAGIYPSQTTLTSAGTVTSGIVGTAAITPAAQTAAASATLAIGATASVTPATQKATASGLIQITGTANLRALAQTLAASGFVGASVIGSASVTPAAQTLSAAGTVSSGGSGLISDPEYIIHQAYRPFKVSAPNRPFRINS